MTRGSEKRERPKLRAARFSPSEDAQLRARCLAAGLTISDYLRSAALAQAPLRAVRSQLRMAPAPELLEVNRLLANLTGNLNQLARQANSAGRMPHQLHLAEIGEEVQRLRRLVLDALAGNAFESDADPDL